MIKLVKAPFPGSPIFDGDNQDPTLVVDNLKKGNLYIYSLKKGNKKYAFIPCSWEDKAVLLSGFSIVKQGRHWWL